MDYVVRYMEIKTLVSFWNVDDMNPITHLANNKMDNSDKKEVTVKTCCNPSESPDPSTTKKKIRIGTKGIIIKVQGFVNFKPYLKSTICF